MEEMKNLKGENPNECGGTIRNFYAGSRLRRSSRFKDLLRIHIIHQLL